MEDKCLNGITATMSSQATGLDWNKITDTDVSNLFVMGESYVQHGPIQEVKRTIRWELMFP